MLHLEVIERLLDMFWFLKLSVGKKMSKKHLLPFLGGLAVCYGWNPREEPAVLRQLPKGALLKDALLELGSARHSD